MCPTTQLFKLNSCSLIGNNTQEIDYSCQLISLLRPCLPILVYIYIMMKIKMWSTYAHTLVNKLFLPLVINSNYGFKNWRQIMATQAWNFLFRSICFQNVEYMKLLNFSFSYQTNILKGFVQSISLRLLHRLTSTNVSNHNNVYVTFLWLCLSSGVKTVSSYLK